MVSFIGSCFPFFKIDRSVTLRIFWWSVDLDLLHFRYYVFCCLQMFLQLSTISLAMTWHSIIRDLS